MIQVNHPVLSRYLTKNRALYPVQCVVMSKTFLQSFPASNIFYSSVLHPPPSSLNDSCIFLNLRGPPKFFDIICPPNRSDWEFKSSQAPLSPCHHCCLLPCLGMCLVWGGVPPGRWSFHPALERGTRLQGCGCWVQKHACTLHAPDAYVSEGKGALEQECQVSW